MKFYEAIEYGNGPPIPVSAPLPKADAQQVADSLADKYRFMAADQYPPHFTIREVKNVT
jgi:hypothetical protein